MGLTYVKWSMKTQADIYRSLWLNWHFSPFVCDCLRWHGWEISGLGSDDIWMNGAGFASGDWKYSIVSQHCTFRSVHCNSAKFSFKITDSINNKNNNFTFSQKYYSTIFCSKYVLYWHWDTQIPTAFSVSVELALNLYPLKEKAILCLSV